MKKSSTLTTWKWGSRLFFLLPLLIPINIIAQNVTNRNGDTSASNKKEARAISGQVLDYITHRRMPGVTVELLRADSTVIKTKKTGGFSQNGDKITYFSYWDFDVVGNGTYLIRFTYEGYQPQYLKFKAVFGRREYTIEAPDVYLKREEVRQLKEVVVTATKVKFYNKGDTLVYNADAFQLSEGSMLDALIRQMPGAELKSDGRIYVNGKFVESLLMNGKDFFKGNNQIMLDNLPTYMVNNVKVYEKQSKTSEFLGHDVDKKSLVMDVNLKKQYSISWMGNIEMGSGLKDRYLTRLFAMRFTDHSHFSAYSNINNLNDTRKPGENDTWKPSDLTGGLISTKMGGIDYSIENRNQKLKAEGNIQIKHSDTDNQSNTNQENFLNGGNTFDRIKNSTRNYHTEIKTSHDIDITTKRMMFTLSPSLEYQKYDNRNEYLSGTFNADPVSFGKSLLDSIYAPQMNAKLRQIAINRNMQHNQTIGHTLNAGLEAGSIFNIPHSSDYWSLETNLSYKDAAENIFQQNRVDYLSNSNVTTDFRNQYTKNRPQHGWDFSGKALYAYSVNKGLTLNLYYKYQQNNYQGRDRSLYRLDQLTGWDDETTHKLGMLPSEAELISTLNFNNSYDATQHDMTHTLGWQLWMNKYTSNYFYWVQIDMPLNLLRQKMNYRQLKSDTLFTRHSTLLNLNNTFLQIESKDKKTLFFTSYYIETETPDMTYLVNVRNDSNPLQLFSGNPNLKNTYHHKWYAVYRKSYSEKQRIFRIQGAYNLTTNAMVMGYTYDKSTGIRTIRPDNVNGNWDGYLKLRYETALDKKRLFTLTTSTTESYYHNVDLIGVENSTDSKRSTVGTSYLTESLKLSYKLNSGIQLGVKADGTWTQASSKRDDFSTINAGDFNYGCTALVSLPRKWQLSTDLTMYSRRGYDDSSMNTNDLVWNARLSKSLWNGKFLFMLDGFDILGNLSNVTRSLTAQGKVEQYTNVMPRYAMLHLVYRLNIAPKKKK